MNDSKTTDEVVWPKMRWLRSRKRWLVDARIGAKGKGGGKRYYYKTKREADGKCVELRVLKKRHGIDALEIPPALRAEAISCNERLAARGKTLKEATDFYIAHLNARQKSIPWAAFIDELLVLKEQDGIGDRQLMDIKSLHRFDDASNSKTVAEITTPQIDDYLRGRKVGKPGETNFGKPIAPITRNNMRRLFVGAFNVAMRKGYCASNPALGVAIAKRPRPNDDEDGEDLQEVTLDDILTPREVKALLESASVAARPYIALGIFAGIRRSELLRLRWSRINWEKKEIFVPIRAAKKERGRYIPLRPALMAWLAPYEGKEGKIVPSTIRKEMKRARIAAHAALSAKKEERDLGFWPSNCCRHSFASYHYSMFNDAKLLAAEMGHRDVNLIFTTYRTPVPKELAEAFWSIFPEGCENGHGHANQGE